MMRVQRRFGKLLPRTADETTVSVILKDFDDADTLLGKIIDSSKAWREGWVSILGTQVKLVTEFDLAYQPIIGAAPSGDGDDPVYAPTDPETQERVHSLKEVYEELRVELLEEVNMVDVRIVKPAMDARDSIQPMKKVIKKREDKKLDYERYQGRVDTMKKKAKLSERDTATLAKTERELARSTEEYQAADAHLIVVLPPVINASFSLIPSLLNSQILIQNTLLAQYYTSLHHYCSEPSNAAYFASPPPPTEEVISTWESQFRPLQHELETGISLVASGRAVRQPMKFEDQKGSTVTGLNIRNGVRQKRIGSSSASSTKPPPPRPAAPPGAALSLPPPLSPHNASPTDNGQMVTTTRPRIPSTSTTLSTSSALSNRLSPATSHSPSEPYSPGVGGAHSPAAPRADYFNRSHQTAPSSSMALTPTSPAATPYGAAASMAAAAAAKKKPPPPKPPAKRNPSSYQQAEHVIALYAFEGQNDGDLTFREGDRIKIVTKTERVDDWWEGEVGGKKGWFPRNYCR